MCKSDYVLTDEQLHKFKKLCNILDVIKNRELKKDLPTIMLNHMYIKGINLKSGNTFYTPNENYDFEICDGDDVIATLHHCNKLDGMKPEDFINLVQTQVLREL